MSKKLDNTSRISFDDGDEYPENDAPQNSPHWQSLDHQDQDLCFQNLDELISCFQKESINPTKTTLAIWSCVAGYCEALATHKERRYSVFPLPIDALRRLIQKEFHQFLLALQIDTDKSNHRDIVRTVSNGIWAKARPKPNVRDEMHANSVYVCLRGDIDKKSLDCFGACLTTIAGLRMLDITASQLCLSEDHAYERHQLDPKDASTIGTCEVAIPGRTKRDQAKRAKEIESTFEDTKESKPYLTPESSWLYMASNPVVCETDAMALVAVVGNINCTIEESRGKGHFFESGQLYVLKREMLWVLHDQGHMKKFPFGLMELGNCEEHRGSPRSSEWVEVPDIKEPILVNEQLFLNAIRVSQEIYNDAQVYPYYYAGHYHKDAGKSGADQEGRFVESLKMYAQGARITSKYPYELQLNKHITTMSMLILDDILMSEDKEPRKWVDSCNAIDCCMWLLVFLDSLLFWEESQHQREQVSVFKSSSNNGRGSGGTKQQFVEILVPSHPQSIGKLLACFDQEIRTQALLNLHSSTRTSNDDGRYEAKLRSKRLQNGSLLCKGVIKPKVTIREMDLAIILEEDDEMSGGRRSKRTRRG